MSNINFTLTERMSYPCCEIIKSGLRVGGISKDNFDDHYTAFFVGGYCSAPQFRFSPDELQLIGNLLNKFNKNIPDALVMIAESNAKDNRAGLPRSGASDCSTVGDV